MPIMFSYNFTGAAPADNNKVQCVLERLGWERVGSSSYRYPPLNARAAPEDWFNRVIPGLMFFRAYALKNRDRIAVELFSIDAQTSTGRSTNAGNAMTGGADIGLADPTSPAHFGEQRLRDWLDAVTGLEI